MSLSVSWRLCESVAEVVIVLDCVPPTTIPAAPKVMVLPCASVVVAESESVLSELTATSCVTASEVVVPAPSALSLSVE